MFFDETFLNQAQNRISFSKFLKTTMTSTRAILEKLIQFDTTSRLPNRELIDYIREVLSEHGIASTLIPNTDGSKANLYSTIGPENQSGVMLSGHTDVVPIEGQNWTRPAFELTQSGGRLYGRGTTDMKGFVACSIVAAINASKNRLVTPLHLGFSYDEEIGCVGVQSLIEMLHQAPIKPAMCIVGEPTNLKVATKHKGKMSISARCIGREGHSALAPNALNAIHLACDLVGVIRQMQADIQQRADLTGVEPGEVPYTTLHVGRINANQALNIVPNLCTVNFEIRHTSQDDPTTLLDEIQQAADRITSTARRKIPEAAIELEVWNAYPGLDTPEESGVVEFVKSLVGANTTTYVAFGTEGGLFSKKLGIPTVVCGPGSMDQGHKPDEYIEIDQLAQCDKMLQRLTEYLINPA